jgi:type VI secretion system protein VasJ
MATYREQVSEKIAPMLAPIAGANPAGADISYDPDFETIKAEIDKLSSVDNSEPSWSRIEQLGATLLAKKGKDFRLVSWMTVAKVKTSAWRGFAESLVLYDTLARSFWDTMYPEARRARARINAVAWMADLVNQALTGKDVTLADGDAVRTCDEALKDLDQLLSEKLGDAYAGPGQLRSLMRDKVRAIPEPPKAPDPATATAVDGAASAGAPPEAVAAQAPAGPASPTRVDQVDDAVLASVKIITDAAAVLRAAEPAGPWPYILQRMGAWLMFVAPPQMENGRTYVPSPGDGHTGDFQELTNGQKWRELLDKAEGMIADQPLWLDLHRHVARAMEGLGAEFVAARDVVGREVSHFVARMPDLVSMAFNDGMPFADAATKSWLEEEAAKWGAGGGSAASAAVSAEDEEVAKRFAEAETMVAGGKIPDGLALAVALADRSPDARARFRARLRIGKMALDAAKPDLARGMLEHLLSDVERHGLEIWEPATCATLYSYLFTATREVVRAKGGSPELEAKEQQLFDKLCRLDPASAIKLST